MRTILTHGYNDRKGTLNGNFLVRFCTKIKNVTILKGITGVCYLINTAKRYVRGLY